MFKLLVLFACCVAVNGSYVCSTNPTPYTFSQLISTIPTTTSSDNTACLFTINNGYVTPTNVTYTYSGTTVENGCPWFGHDDRDLFNSSCTIKFGKTFINETESYECCCKGDYCSNFFVNLYANQQSDMLLTSLTASKAVTSGTLQQYYVNWEQPFYAQNLTRTFVQLNYLYGLSSCATSGFRQAYHTVAPYGISYCVSIFMQTLPPTATHSPTHTHAPTHTYAPTAAPQAAFVKDEDNDSNRNRNTGFIVGVSFVAVLVVAAIIASIVIMCN